MFNLHTLLSHNLPVVEFSVLNVTLVARDAILSNRVVTFCSHKPHTIADGIFFDAILNFRHFDTYFLNCIILCDILLLDITFAQADILYIYFSCTSS